MNHIRRTLLVAATSLAFATAAHAKDPKELVIGTSSGPYSDQLKLGIKPILEKKCSNCHKEPLFTDGSFRNNGLAPSPVNDQGLYNATLQETDRLKFKMPSLRNLSYTAPYMHDGRFLTLESVFEHYNSEVQPTTNLDPLLRQNGKYGITLSADDRKKLAAFLKTLDDEKQVDL